MIQDLINNSVMECLRDSKGFVEITIHLNGYKSRVLVTKRMHRELLTEEQKIMFCTF